MNGSEDVTDLVVPGDTLGEEGMVPGYGTIKRGDDIISTRIGLVSVRGNTVNVIPIRGKYLPRRDDLVIGTVREYSNTNWSFDLNSPYTAFLHFKDVPWDVDFGETGEYLSVGDAAILRITDVDVRYRTTVVLNGPGLKKLNGGRLVKINPTMVPLVIGKNGSMISVLKGATSCRIFIGQNGVLWVDGEPEDVDLVLGALDLIERRCYSKQLNKEIELYFADARMFH